MNAKKIFFAGVCLLAACFTQAQEETQSQMPKAFSYQAVVRNSQGKVIAKQPVGIKVEILQGSTEGSVVYAETQTPESSQTGTVNLLIGTGTATQGVFADIDWGAATYFLRISMDLQGGSNYEVVSTTQMLPVPYALYAEKAGSVVNNGESTPETPSDGTIKYGRDFFLVPADQNIHTEVLYDITGSGYIEKYGSSTTLEFNIVYLTGLDLSLNAMIEGSLMYESASTILGRHYIFVIKKPTDSNIFSSTLNIADDKDNVLISFPVTIKYVE